MGLRRWSLRTQAALATALLVMALTAVLTWYVGWVSGHRMTRDIGDGLAESSAQMADALDRAMWTRFRELRALAAMPGFAEPTANRPAVAATLEALQDAVPQFSWLALVSPEGIVLESTDNILEGADISHRPVYQQARNGVYFGDVHDALLLAQHLPHPNGQPLQFVDIAFPLTAEDGSLLGILSAHLSWTWASEVERELLIPFGSRMNMDLFVVGESGDVLLGSTGPRGARPAVAALDRATAGETGWMIETWPDGRDYLTGFAPTTGLEAFPGLNWRVLVRRPVDEALAPVRDLQHTIALAGAVLASVFAALGWLATGPITAPLRRITAAADHLRQHGAPHTAHPVPHVRGSREIESLSHSLRALLDSLRSSHAALGDMEDKARRDPLTGLPNRRGLDLWMREALARCDREEDRGLAFLVMDLDGFKRANDSLGHAAGDAVLVDVARRLHRLSRANDLVARLGGDEFLMVMEIKGPPDLSAVTMVGERLIHALNAPIDTPAGEVQIGCSIGSAFWPWDADTPVSTMRKADEALYVSKAEGKNHLRHYAAVTGRREMQSAGDHR